MADIEREMDAARDALPDELRAITVTVPRSYLRYLEQKVIALAQQPAGAVEALDEAIKAARTFNRNGMTWQEYDRKLVELEQFVNHARGRCDD